MVKIIWLRSFGENKMKNGVCMIFVGKSKNLALCFQKKVSFVSSEISIGMLVMLFWDVRLKL